VILDTTYHPHPLLRDLVLAALRKTTLTEQPLVRKIILEAKVTVFPCNCCDDAWFTDCSLWKDTSFSLTRGHRCQHTNIVLRRESNRKLFQLKAEYFVLKLRWPKSAKCFIIIIIIIIQSMKPVIHIKVAIDKQHLKMVAANKSLFRIYTYLFVKLSYVTSPAIGRLFGVAG